MSIAVTLANIIDPLLDAVAGAPAFAVLIGSFVIVGLLESWRPFFERKQEPRGRMVTNFGLGIINAGIQLVAPLSVLLAAGWAERQHFGLLNRVDLPFAVEAVAAVLLYSLASYWVHRLSHRIPALWRIHHVHHADTHIDLSTGFRNHPAELVLVILLLGVIAASAGLPPFILLAYQIVAAGFALWTHADFALPERADRLLRILFVTPAMHHVHHSALQPQTDSNYGEIFSFWDRLFGSYCYMTPTELRAMRVGLGDAHDPGAASFMKQLVSPVRSRAIS